MFVGAAIFDAGITVVEAGTFFKRDFRIEVVSLGLRPNCPKKFKFILKCII